MIFYTFITDIIIKSKCEIVLMLVLYSRCRKFRYFIGFLDVTETENGKLILYS